MEWLHVCFPELPKTTSTKYQSPVSVASAINDMADVICHRGQGQGNAEGKGIKQAIEEAGQHKVHHWPS